jgi:hypothetical protein
MEIFPDDSASQNGADGMTLKERRTAMERELLNERIRSEHSEYDTRSRVSHQSKKTMESAMPKPEPDIESESHEEPAPLTREEELAISHKIRENVKMYLEAEEKHKRILAVSREITKQKKQLSNQILEDMMKIGVENLNLREGKLVAKRGFYKVSLSKTNMMSMLTRHFDDLSLVGKIIQILTDERDKTERIKLAHAKS